MSFNHFKEGKIIPTNDRAKYDKENNKTYLGVDGDFIETENPELIKLFLEHENEKLKYNYKEKILNFIYKIIRILIPLSILIFSYKLGIGAAILEFISQYNILSKLTPKFKLPSSF